MAQTLAATLALADAQIDVGELELLHVEQRCALQLAQDAYELTDRRRTRLLASCEELRNEVAQARVSRSLASRLPLEVLSKVFKVIQPAYSPSEHGLAKKFKDGDCIEYERIVLPRVLAGVSKHWRDAVQVTPELRSYIGVPSDAPSLGKFLSSLGSKLHGTHLIDLHIQATDILPPAPDSGEPSRTAIFFHNAFWRSVFDLIYEHIGRLRTIDIEITVDQHTRPRVPALFENARDLALGLLRLDMPELQEASVAFRGIDIDASEGPDAYWGPIPNVTLPVYFPQARNLQWLRLHDVPVACVRPTHPGLPSLRTLSITCGCLCDSYVHNMLALSPALEELYIYTECVNHDLTPAESPPFKSPVRRLCLANAGAEYISFDRIDLPNLASLAMLRSSGSDCPSLLQKVAGTLTELEFGGWFETEYALESLDKLSGLKKVERVTIRSENFEVPLLCKLLCREDDPLWPRLKSLVLET